MTRPPLRIAILECDEPIGHTKEKYGSYGNLFKELLENGAKQLAEEKTGEEPELDITKFDVVNHEVYPELERVDAVLLTGSRYNSFDDDPWILKLVQFTRKVLAQDRVRLIGVCFGHQIIGRALDVKVDRSDRGWEISVTNVQLTEQGKKLFQIEELAIHQMHRDIVYEYPKGIEPLGHSPRCDVQGMYAKNRLVTVQGHPEFTGDIVAELLDSRHQMGIFDDAMYKDGMERVRKHHDGVTIGAAFLRFLLDD
ncbi:Putative glutamine amidotransferase domain containing protein ChyE [Septoria linicola]|uniref:Glutamine amidotransferase domain containing protein ChyE n=1 Tax=Septoria linicola TaxID=215465 RepID=A0A9Q9AYC9_9PEZI|nr:Putative glutamine amidotransferase domain containing protein ChyE [Septoria linicola]